MKVLVLARYLLIDLISDRGRSLLTIFSLAVVVLSYLLISMLDGAFRAYGGNSLAVGRNLMLISADVLDPMESSLDLEILDDAANAIQAAFGAEVVGKTSPVIFRHMRIDSWTFQVAAVPREDMPTIYQLALLEGELPEMADQIVVSDRAISLAGWKVGEQIEIYGNKFQIMGIVQAEGSQAASIWMTYPAGERLFSTRRGFQIGVIQISTLVDAEVVRAHLETEPRLSGYAVYLEHQISERYNQVTRDILNLTIVFQVLALALITFGVYNATSLTLEERSREVAILRVIGFSPRAIRNFLFGRVLLQMLVAFLFGLGGAVLFTIRQQTQSPVIFGSVPLSFTLSWSSIWLGLALTIGFAYLGVWLPTWQQFRSSIAAQIG